ncbi:unnamed protein product, partial [Protopolystoma xenopodis]
DPIHPPPKSANSPRSISSTTTTPNFSSCHSDSAAPAGNSQPASNRNLSIHVCPSVSFSSSAPFISVTSSANTNNFSDINCMNDDENVNNISKNASDSNNSSSKKSDNHNNSICGPADIIPGLYADPFAGVAAAAAAMAAMNQFHQMPGNRPNHLPGGLSLPLGLPGQFGLPIPDVGPKNGVPVPDGDTLAFTHPPSSSSNCLNPSPASSPIYSSSNLTNSAPFFASSAVNNGQPGVDAFTSMGLTSSARLTADLMISLAGYVSPTIGPASGLGLEIGGLKLGGSLPIGCVAGSGLMGSGGTPLLGSVPVPGHCSPITSLLPPGQ